MWLYLDDRFADHDTGDHPECPARIERVNARLRQPGGIAERCDCPAWQPASRDALTAVHGDDYLHALHAAIDELAAGTRRSIEADTVVSSRSWDVARLASGAALDAVDHVLASDEAAADVGARRAAILGRPPGHHARPSAAMGFCLFNHVAVAARHALTAHQLERVLIIDFDVHHGNGTQEIFYEDGQVAYLSLHRAPFYPGTGRRDETGSGAGLGTTLNEPVAFGTPVPTILSRYRHAVETMVSRHRPQLILISAGFDAHREDPIGSLGLETEDFATLTSVITAAAASAEGRIISLLEGGYHLVRLADSVELHLETLLA